MPKLISVLVLISLLASCRSAPTHSDEQASSISKIEAPQNSGHRLKGLYDWQTSEDDYRVKEDGLRFEITFDESGTFSRKKIASGEARLEEGLYILGVGDELVLFIEKIGGEQVEHARVERYRISAQTDREIKLQADSAGSFILRKRL